jgi:DNA-binding MarR family transcriptional regulator
MPRKVKKIPLDAVEAKLAEAMRLRQQLQKVAAEIREETGFTDARAIVMMSLLRRPNISQTDLVGLTGTDRSTTATLIKKLMRMGLVTKTRNAKDGRKYVVRLSAKGEKVYRTGA